MKLYPMIFALVLASACTSNNFSGPLKTEKKSDEAEEDIETDEDIEAGTPVMVTGSYLTTDCSLLPEFSFIPEFAGFSQAFKCGFYDEDKKYVGKKVDSADCGNPTGQVKTVIESPEAGFQFYLGFASAEATLAETSCKITTEGQAFTFENLGKVTPDKKPDDSLKTIVLKFQGPDCLDGMEQPEGSLPPEIKGGGTCNVYEEFQSSALNFDGNNSVELKSPDVLSTFLKRDFLLSLSYRPSATPGTTNRMVLFFAGGVSEDEPAITIISCPTCNDKITANLWEQSGNAVAIESTATLDPQKWNRITLKKTGSDVELQVEGFPAAKGQWSNLPDAEGVIIGRDPSGSSRNVSVALQGYMNYFELQSLPQGTP